MNTSIAKLKELKEHLCFKGNVFNLEMFRLLVMIGFGPQRVVITSQQHCT